MLEGRNILLGVTGGIAAYKACELARMLVREGAQVQVALTPRAAEFVTPLSFAALTSNSALVSEFPRPGEQPEGDVFAHLNLTRRLDAYVIAPATANTLAHLAAGFADNLVCAAYLSCEAPVILAPAMNTRMWQHPATRTNLAVLRKRGHIIIEPAEGELACGDTGTGRLAGLEEIFSAVVLAATGGGGTHTSRLAGRRIVVTAGGTREYLDPVRFITNASSGRLGLEVVAELSRQGAQVELIDTGIEVPDSVASRLTSRQTVRTAYDLEQAISSSLDNADGLVMLAAVADFSPAHYESSKHKKDGQAWHLDLTETRDILRLMTGRRRPGQVFVGVSLEDRDWLERGRAKAASKAVDLNLAVELGADLPFGDHRLNCALVTADEILEPAAQRSKQDAARLLVGWIDKWFAREN